jgi:hypothetical protein
MYKNTQLTPASGYDTKRMIFSEPQGGTIPDSNPQTINQIIDTMDEASKRGDLEVVKYLHGIGKECTVWAMNLASRNGHLEVVKYLHSIGKECTTNAMDLASDNGHFEVVKCLYSIGKDCTSTV